jgi:PUA domain protein
VRDETHQRPLAIGEALLDGVAMVAATRGKAVKTLHYIGDSIWHYGNED